MLISILVCQRNSIRLRIFASNVIKWCYFGTSKIYFIYLNKLLYNTHYITYSIPLPFCLNIFSLFFKFFFYSFYYYLWWVVEWGTKRVRLISGCEREERYFCIKERESRIKIPKRAKTTNTTYKTVPFYCENINVANAKFMWYLIYLV